MPATHTEVASKDFIQWAFRHIRFPGTEQLTGEDLYGARCALLHSYTAQSKLIVWDAVESCFTFMSRLASARCPIITPKPLCLEKSVRCARLRLG